MAASLIHGWASCLRHGKSFCVWEFRGGREQAKAALGRAAVCGLDSCRETAGSSQRPFHQRPLWEVAVRRPVQGWGTWNGAAGSKGIVMFPAPYSQQGENKKGPLCRSSSSSGIIQVSVVSNATCSPPDSLTTNGKWISPEFPGSICWHLGTKTPRWPRHVVASHPDVRCRHAPERNGWPVWPEARPLLNLPSASSDSVLWSLKIDRLTPLKWLRWQGGRRRGGWDGKCLRRTSYASAGKPSTGWPPDLKNAKSIF